MMPTHSWSRTTRCSCVSRLGPTYALHARLDGEAWRFVRHLALAAPDAVRAGFLVQSPTGDGATARFDEIGFVAERLADLRSGI
jgi:regulation of enolase protein 1 (concanavalin A-like superfamily)